MVTLPKLWEPPSLKAPVMASTGYLGFQASDSIILGGLLSGTVQGFLPAELHTKVSPPKNLFYAAAM